MKGIVKLFVNGFICGAACEFGAQFYRDVLKEKMQVVNYKIKKKMDCDKRA